MTSIREIQIYFHGGDEISCIFHLIFTPACRHNPALSSIHIMQISSFGYFSMLLKPNIYQDVLLFQRKYYAEIRILCFE